MRLAPLFLSIALLGTPGDLFAAKPAKRSVKQRVVPAANRSVHKVRRGETAAKIARTYGLSLNELSDLNPSVRLSKLSVGLALRVKAAPEPVVARVAEEVAPPPLEPVVPMAPLPVIQGSGPAVLVHLERLIPTNTSHRPIVPLRNSARITSPLPAEDLAPVFPQNAGLEYASKVATDLGFEPADPGSLDMLWPVETRSISSSWGPRVRTKVVRVVNKAKKKRRVRVRYQGSHKGVDLTAPRGTDVYAAQDGRVVVAERDRGYGNFVVLDHGNGVTTLYAHHQVNLVEAGQVVRRGQKIAEVGSTGRSTGPHLHFELRLNGEHLNPLPVLNDEEEIPAEMVALNEMITPSRR